jgi:hypothetical protein
MENYEKENTRVVERIVEIAKTKIDGAGCTWVDKYATFYCGLLDELGYPELSNEVYDYYEKL